MSIVRCVNGDMEGVCLTKPKDDEMLCNMELLDE